MKQRSQRVTLLDPRNPATVARQVDETTMKDMNNASQSTWRPSRVRERLISALIPDSLGSGEGVMGAPLPVLPTLRRLEKTAPGTLLVSTTRMDRSGRVHERLLLDELGWHPGRQLDMDTMHGMIIIAATPAGRHTVDTRGAIGLPAALRRLCGIECGPPLVLAAAIPEQVMVIHPAATVAHLLATHYTDLLQTEHVPRTAPARTSPAAVPDARTCRDN